MFITNTVNIRVEFQALTDLVAYLTGKQQEQIDALTAQIQKLTEGLNHSTTGLSGSVQENT